MDMTYMLSLLPAASIAFLALMIPLTVMKNAANFSGSVSAIARYTCQ